MSKPHEQDSADESAIPNNSLKAEVEDLKQQSDIKKALQQTAGAPPAPSPTVEKKQKMFLGTYAVIFLVLAGAYYFLQLHLFTLSPALLKFLQRADLGALAIATVICVFKS